METIRIIREVAGVTQVELARDLGISPEHLCRVERGDREPSPELKCRALDAIEAHLSRKSGAV